MPSGTCRYSPSSSAPRRLPSRAPSSEEGGRSRRGADLLAPPSSRGTRWGSLVHHLLDGIEWPGIEALDEQALLDRGAPLEPDLSTRRDAVAYLREALARPELQAALSPGPDAGARRVWTERRFCEVVQEPDGPVMRRGAFDRVVLELDGERVTGATIQDYKTDAFAAEDLEAKVAHYAPQLAVYRSVLCKMKGLALGDVRAQLLFLGPGLVCEVPLDALEAPAAGSPADSGAEAGGAALPEHPRASEQDVPAPGAPAGQGELPF